MDTLTRMAPALTTRFHECIGSMCDVCIAESRAAYERKQGAQASAVSRAVDDQLALAAVLDDTRHPLAAAVVRAGHRELGEAICADLTWTGSPSHDPVDGAICKAVEAWRLGRAFAHLTVAAYELISARSVL